MIPSPELCNTVDNLTRSFLGPMKTLTKEILFATPGTYLPPPFPQTLAKYSCLFPNDCMLKGDWRDLRIYDQETARSQILAKASKIPPLYKAPAPNIYQLSRLRGPTERTSTPLNPSHYTAT